MNKKNIYLIIVLLVCVSILEISAGAYYFLQYPNIQTSQKKYIDFYVPKNSTWQSVKDSLKSNNLIKLPINRLRQARNFTGILYRKLNPELHYLTDAPIDYEPKYNKKLLSLDANVV